MLAGALALVAGAGCSATPTDRSPVGVAKRFVASVQARDTEAIFELLGPETRARLEKAAKRATQLGGGKPVRQAHEMLSPAWRSRAEPNWTPKGFKLLSKTDTRARVEIRGEKKGQRAVLTLVREDGRWRIKLPRPPF